MHAFPFAAVDNLFSLRRGWHHEEGVDGCADSWCLSVHDCNGGLCVMFLIRFGRHYDCVPIDSCKTCKIDAATFLHLAKISTRIVLFYVRM